MGCEVLVIRSERLAREGFAHGFATRIGGVSQPPFDALNFSEIVGDDPDRVAENHRRLARAIGYAVERLYQVRQVHGAGVRVIEAGDDPWAVRASEADALVAAERGAAIGVRTADCVPLLVADPERGVVAAIHAGWRGVVAGVIAAAVSALRGRAGAPASRLVAAIGPHIRAASFEVGEDVATQIAGAAPGAEVVVRAVGARPRVDLARAASAQLAALGLPRDRIDDVGGDTFADAGRFYSHRRDGARSGRHLSVIVARGA
jgi:YfiH family protein